MDKYSDYRTLDIDARNDGVVVVTLNRPDRLNAFNGVMRHEIRRMIDQIGKDDDARAPTPQVRDDEVRAFAETRCEAAGVFPPSIFVCSHTSPVWPSRFAAAMPRATPTWLR